MLDFQGVLVNIYQIKKLKGLPVTQEVLSNNYYRNLTEN